jgi:hypothetical protein
MRTSCMIQPVFDYVRLKDGEALILAWLRGSVALLHQTWWWYFWLGCSEISLYAFLRKGEFTVSACKLNARLRLPSPIHFCSIAYVYTSTNIKLKETKIHV